MTRIFTDGAEMGDVLFWNSSVATVETSTPYISDYYYYITSSGETYKILSSPLTECYLRERIKRDTGSTGLRLPSFYTDTTELAYLTLDASYIIEARTTGSLLLNSEVVMDTSWHLYEIYFKLGDSPDGMFIVYMDGVKIIDFTGDTKPGTSTTFNKIYYSRGGEGSFCFDDLALNDTNNDNNKNDNSWCGDGIIGKIYPSGSGTVNDFCNSGSTLGNNNYLYVDEYPGDEDTSYVYASGSSVGERDHYPLSSFNGTDKIILRVYPEARARKTSPTGSTAKLGLLPFGGSVAISGSTPLYIRSYARVVGDEVKINPVTSASWTDGDVNALEFVAEIGSSG